MTTTQSAVGVHAHPFKKLGARPVDPSRAHVAFSSVLRTYPTHPLVDAQPTADYPMDHNDEAGVCVVACRDHAEQIVADLLGLSRKPMTDAQILADYQTQNPGFTGWSKAGSEADGGMDPSKYLSYLQRQGRILAFAQVDHTDEEQVKAAVYLGLALDGAATLTKANGDEQVWDNHAGDEVWGGHAWTVGGYAAEKSTHDEAAQIVSWGSGDYGITRAFLSKNVSSMFFVLTQAHVDHPRFRDYVDLDAWAAAFTDLTGRAFPDVKPTPAPTPTPTPTPAPDAEAQFKTAAAEWLSHNHTSKVNTVFVKALRSYLATL